MQHSTDFHDDTAPATLEFSILGYTVEGKYVESTLGSQWNPGQRDKYKYKDDKINVTYSVKHDDKSIVEYDVHSSSLFKNTEEDKKTIDECRDTAYSQLVSYAKDPERYELVSEKSKSSDGIPSYKFTFQKKIDGYKADDSFTICITEYGDIQSLSVYTDKIMLQHMPADYDDEYVITKIIGELKNMLIPEISDNDISDMLTRLNVDKGYIRMLDNNSYFIKYDTSLRHEYENGHLRGIPISFCIILGEGD